MGLERSSRLAQFIFLVFGSFAVISGCSSDDLADATVSSPSVTPEPATSTRRPQSTVTTAISPAETSTTIPPSPTTPSTTATPTTSPSSTPISETASFSLETANRTVPDDILEEVYFWEGGGGRLLCMTADDGSTFWSAQDVLEQNDSILIVVCGWDADRRVVEVTFPTGETKRLSGDLLPAVDDSSQYLELSFVFELGGPLGTYTFTFPSGDGIEQESVTVIAPPDPRLYSYTNSIVEELLLYNLHPGEEVRLFAYRPLERSAQGTLVGWAIYNAGPDGTLRILDLPEEKLRYAAVGELSGEVPSFRV